ncbi:hypothetical protein SAMD00019534_059600 [Acytostelium subglobosum LB1]|uniref:hypothetical protein n=1 Tax=Acytostelium subglobosum LB1 TaxID=1410327 RepID=UPI0006451C1A|nr:hypothetical protein SAMD00019534_059600 [Acytostelium subglobosum LB1]GAM22785.1 hypothetical protein SAMD00019534_059600 [Acytostelium subglobosum LB1]|eukprot:XP_012754012.1 hypothetical protein SAMD00019534_059600 [Acytostelium subglobosum LB1]
METDDGQYHQHDNVDVGVQQEEQQHQVEYTYENQEEHQQQHYDNAEQQEYEHEHGHVHNEDQQQQEEVQHTDYQQQYTYDNQEEQQYEQQYEQQHYNVEEHTPQQEEVQEHQQHYDADYEQQQQAVDNSTSYDEYTQTSEEQPQHDTTDNHVQHDEQLAQHQDHQDQYASYETEQQPQQEPEQAQEQGEEQGEEQPYYDQSSEGYTSPSLLSHTSQTQDSMSVYAESEGQAETDGEVASCYSPLSVHQETDSNVALSESIDVSSVGSTPEHFDETFDSTLSHRSRLIREVVSSERSFSNHLNSVITLYLEPLRNNRPAILEKEHFESIFSCIETIKQMSDEVLVELDEAIKSGNENVAKPFLSRMARYKDYLQYGKNHGIAIELIAKLMEKKPSFVTFIHGVRDTQAQQSRLDLQAYLIMPVQRMPRIKLLFNEILDQTEPEHIDYHDIKNFLEFISKATKDMNEEIRKQENKLKVEKIQNELAGGPRIISEGRVFVREGTLMKVCRKVPKPRFFFLFSDILIYATKSTPIMQSGSSTNMAQQANTHFVFHRLMKLKDIKIKDLPDKDTQKNAFQIISTTEKSFTVYTETPKEKTNWLDDLRQLGGGGGTKQGEDGVEVPVWVPDKDASKCMFCNDSFTIINRRHHCRNCGKVVCGSCSPAKKLLPHVKKDKPVRVCLYCYDFITMSGSGHGHDLSTVGGAGAPRSMTPPNPAMTGSGVRSSAMFKLNSLLGDKNSKRRSTMYPNSNGQSQDPSASSPNLTSSGGGKRDTITGKFRRLKHVIKKDGSDDRPSHSTLDRTNSDPHLITRTKPVGTPMTGSVPILPVAAPVPSRPDRNSRIISTTTPPAPTTTTAPPVVTAHPPVNNNVQPSAFNPMVAPPVPNRGLRKAPAVTQSPPPPTNNVQQIHHPHAFQQQHQLFQQQHQQYQQQQQQQHSSPPLPSKPTSPGLAPVVPRPIPTNSNTRTHTTTPTTHSQVTTPPSNVPRVASTSYKLAPVPTPVPHTTTTTEPQQRRSIPPRDSLAPVSPRKPISPRKPMASPSHNHESPSKRVGSSEIVRSSTGSVSSIIQNFNKLATTPTTSPTLQSSVQESRRKSNQMAPLDETQPAPFPRRSNPPLRPTSTNLGLATVEEVQTPPKEIQPQPATLQRRSNPPLKPMVVPTATTQANPIATPIPSSSVHQPVPRTTEPRPLPKPTGFPLMGSVTNHTTSGRALPTPPKTTSVHTQPQQPTLDPTPVTAATPTATPPTHHQPLTKEPINPSSTNSPPLRANPPPKPKSLRPNVLPPTPQKQT